MGGRCCGVLEPSDMCVNRMIMATTLVANIMQIVARMAVRQHIQPCLPAFLNHVTGCPGGVHARVGGNGYGKTKKSDGSGSVLSNRTDIVARRMNHKCFDALVLY